MMAREFHINPFLFFYLFIVATLSFLILNNQIILAGRVLTIAFAFVLIISFFQKNQALFFTMAIFVLSPFLAFLRQYVISYNGASIILVIALTLWLLKDRGKTFGRTISDRRILSICIFITFFILYGIFGGVSLNRFMKYIETVLSILIFSMSLNYFDSVKKSFIYFIISSILIVLSLLQHIDTRFVFESGVESFKADPSAYSIGLVLAAFFLNEEKGTWIFNNSGSKAKRLRYPLVIAIIILTFLTTSRIGFFTLIGSFLIFAVISRDGVKSLKSVGIAVLIAFVFITNSKYYDISERWFNKTFKNEKGIASASSGRSDQWKMAWYYLNNGKMDEVLFGYGPGKAPLFTSKYSTIVPGVKTLIGKSMQLHSLYLNIMVEYGLIAFLFFVLFIYYCWKNAYANYKLYHFSLPLLSLIGYLIYIGSVSGNGIIPAMFISLFMLKPNQLIPDEGSYDAGMINND